MPTTQRMTKQVAEIVYKMNQAGRTGLQSFCQGIDWNRDAQERINGTGSALGIKTDEMLRRAHKEFTRAAGGYSMALAYAHALYHLSVGLGVGEAESRVYEEMRTFYAQRAVEAYRNGDDTGRPNWDGYLIHGEPTAREGNVWETDVIAQRARLAARMALVQ